MKFYKNLNPLYQKLTFFILFLFVTFPHFPADANLSCVQLFSNEENPQWISQQMSDLNAQWIKIVSERLQRAIFERNIKGPKTTQTTLSKDIGISTTHMNRIYNGDYALEISRAEKIAEVLDIPLHELLAVDFLKDFNESIFTVEKSYFKGLNNLTDLKKIFILYIWGDSFTWSPLNNGSALPPKTATLSETFCIGDCTTEQLTGELMRRGYEVNLKKVPKEEK